MPPLSMPLPSHPKRLDQMMVDVGLVASRSRAQAMITSGKIRLRGRIAKKPSETVFQRAEIELIEADHPYVSRGGLKLEAALDAFIINPEGWVVLDVGISTGGFTHCLLLRGAKHVYGVDVGHGQLAEELRSHSAVTLFEQTNMRDFLPTALPTAVDAVVVDVSFISVTKILPLLPAFLKSGGSLIVLIKPQFEVGRQGLDGNGVVKDSGCYAGIIAGIESQVCSLGFTTCGTIESPIAGGEGNREFLLYARQNR